MCIKKDNNILVSNFLDDFFDPKEVYIPIIDQASLNIKTKTVKKGELLFSNSNKKLFSPISGTLKNIVTINNQKYLIIKNNFKEEQRKKNKKKLKYEKEEILELINKYYPEFNLEKVSDILYFKVLNDDIYNANNKFIFAKYLDDILDVLDIIREMYGFIEVKILLKENDSESISLFSNILGRYPFISITLLPDIYPIAHNLLLEKHFNTKMSIVDVDNILNILYAIFYHQPFLECYITISGNILNREVIKVKKGTNLNEILKRLEITNKKAHINNILNRSIDINNLIIDEKIKSILFLEETEKERPCISCGKCLKVCPMGCEPILNKRMAKCISCGLCEYVCPSFLKLRRQENECTFKQKD